MIITMMKTIQMTIDELLLQQVDAQVKDLNTTRSAFIREALEKALQAHRIKRLEERDSAGYSVKPITKKDDKEIASWESEQVWGDTWNEER